MGANNDGVPKTFFVTGAASGIGKHLTRVLAEKGHNVLGTDIQEGALKEVGALSTAGKIATFVMDVTKPDAWEKAFDFAEQNFGPVDVLMNVAGFLKPGFIHEVDDRAVDLHIDVNVKGVIWGTRTAARRMVKRGTGHIVNFGSLASMAAVPGLCLYSASKFAVRGLSLAATAELLPFGVAVTLVMPDAVKTPMLDLQVHYKEAALTFSGNAPLSVEDIEKAIFDVVLPKKPMEITLPLSRGVMARIATFAPKMALLLAPELTKKGLKAQESMRKKG